MKNTTLEQKAYEISGTGNCMYCGAEYDLRKRCEEVRNPKSSNALGCCSNKCLALEDSLQETS